MDAATTRLLSKNTLDPITGLNYARHQVLSVSTSPHQHDFMEVFLITDGAITHLINGEQELLRTGALRLIRPDDAHTYRRLAATSCELYNVAFSKSFYTAAGNVLDAMPLFEAMLDCDTPPGLSLPTETAKTMGTRLSEAGTAMVSEREMAAITLKSLLVELIALLAGTIAERMDESLATAPKWLREVCRRTKAERLYLQGPQAMLRVAGRSHEHVCREFKRALGQTPTEYVNSLRLGHAASALAGSDDKIHAVALDAGFESLSHFHHLFKKRYGMSPARYRASARHPAIPG